MTHGTNMNSTNPERERYMKIYEELEKHVAYMKVRNSIIDQLRLVIQSNPDIAYFIEDGALIPFTQDTLCFVGNKEPSIVSINLDIQGKNWTIKFMSLISYNAYWNQRFNSLRTIYR